MPARSKLDITQDERLALIQARDHHKQPYIRERAAALLKIADGTPVYQVALNGLLKPRKPDSVNEWLARYRSGGIEGLNIKNGRGRKPAFSPSRTKPPTGCRKFTR